jgi:transposase
LVFIDETSTYLEMTRSHARSAIGQQAICKRSAGRKSNISLVGAISAQGMRELYPYDGAIDGERFLAFLDRLLPVLKPGNVIVMDNLRVHHIAEVKERLKAAGIGLLYLPPYSPERNPIEEAWALIKRVFKSAEASTIGGYIDTMRQAFSVVTQEISTALFRHAGYALN